jgi:hypothetical protein
VYNYKNNNEEYIKLLKSIESKVQDSLSCKKTFLKLAIFSLIESMRNNPEKYSSLVYHNNENQNSSSTSIDDRRQIVLPPPPYDYYIIDGYKAITLEKAEKLYNVLTNQLVCEVVNENVAMSSAALPAALSLEGDNKEEHNEQNDVGPKDEQ